MELHAAQTAISSTEEVTEPALGSATEQTRSELLVYSILNAFTGNVKFDNPETERILRVALKDESHWIPETQLLADACVAIS